MFSRRSDIDQKKEAEVKAKLLSAFSVMKLRALELFKRRVLPADEPVDAYVPDLQKLSRWSGYKAVDAEKDPIVI